MSILQTEATEEGVACRDCWNCLNAVELPECGITEQCPHCGAYGPHGEGPQKTQVTDATRSVE
jgi:hypothetical protein